MIHTNYGGHGCLTTILGSSTYSTFPFPFVTSFAFPFTTALGFFWGNFFVVQSAFALDLAIANLRQKFHNNQWNAQL